MIGLAVYELSRKCLSAGRIGSIFINGVAFTVPITVLATDYS